MKYGNIPALPFYIEKENIISTGMTLADYYAAQALVGYLSKGLSIDHAVEYSWEVAEKMLQKRAEYLNK
jgi:hypothetical protein